MSRTLPSFYYRDPAEVIERVQMDRLGCRACVSHSVVLGRVMCGDERNEHQVGVPSVGHRCKWFIDRR
jgi:hypothetical protein